MKNTLHYVLSLLTLILCIISVEYLSSDIKTHHCNWEDCKYNNLNYNEEEFISSWGYDKDTDGYLCELTHMRNPSWTYEQCEEYIFNTNNLDYGYIPK